MKKFSDYVYNSNNASTEVERHDTNNVNSQNMEELIDKYSKFSSNELMNEFVKMTIERKKRGELKEQEIAQLKNTLAQYLSEEQKNNLDRILNMVNNV